MYYLTFIRIDKIWVYLVNSVNNYNFTLIDAFPTTASLEQMLAFELDKNLRAIAGEGSLQDIVFKLVQRASAEGWVEDLVSLRAHIREVFEELYNDQQ